MHLVLVLPGFTARPDSDERAGRRRLHALARIVGAAGVPLREPEGLAAALAQRYAIARQLDWPLASLRLAALGIDPGTAYWLAADPVTLVAGRDDVRPAEAITDLASADADRLIATLNRHFAADGLVFVAPRPDAWFVRAPTPPQMVTHALDAAAGRPLRTLLPEGPDAGPWRRWLSEIQMLFHEHPVNIERERGGGARINSVWFSGGGILPPHTTTGMRIRTWANSGIATALALRAGAPAHALPADLGAVLIGAHEDEDHVVVLEAPLDPATVEAAWAAKAWDALAAGMVETVTLIADGAGNAITWTARRPSHWQRLRQRFSKPDLEALLDAARATP